nr:MAG: replication initiator protein [Microvirus sp.]
MTHESKFHLQSSFITLTYSDKLLTSNSLQYPHVTNFIKRLRSKIDQPIKYYQVGEYGDQNLRPHFHIAMFGYDFTDDITYKGISNTRELSYSKDSHNYYSSTFLTELWGKGFAQVTELNFETAQYVAKYVTKKLNKKQYASLNLEPEKSSSSNKEPIGKRWIEKNYKDVYPNDYVVYKEKKYIPPRYYDEWLQKNVPELWKETKEKRENSIDDSFSDYYDSYAKHKIKIQKQKLFLRDGCAPNLINDEEMVNRNYAQYLLSRRKDL